MNIVIILLLVALVLTLSSCKKKTPTATDPVKDPAESTEDVGGDEVNREKIMAEFDNILKSSELNQIVGYIDENIGKLTQIEGDKMLSELERALEQSLDATTDAVLQGDPNGELMNIAGTESFFPEDKIKDIQDEKLRDEITKIMNNNYKLINVEGSFYPIIDYEKLKKYNNYISDEMKEYIEIKALDSSEPVAADGGLRISYDDLADRILQTEKFIGKYSQGQRYEEMLRNYKNKLVLYLGGLDNTPIADFKTKKIYDDVLASYNKVAKVKDSATAFVVNKYIDTIKENNLIINKAVEEKIVSLVNEALSLLEVSK